MPDPITPSALTMPPAAPEVGGQPGAGTVVPIARPAASAPAPAEVSAQLAPVADRLLDRLTRQRESALAMFAWYRAEQPAPLYVLDAWNAPLKRLRETARSAWARLIVDTIAERLEVAGYASSTATRTIDLNAWRILQANGIDADQRETHTVALLVGTSYVSVTPDPADTSTPIVAVESPLEVAHLPRRGNPRAVDAALKVVPGVDADGRSTLTLELVTPEVVVRASVYRQRDEAGLPSVAAWRAAVEDADGGATVEPNPLGVVPVVAFENRPIGGRGRSELADLVPVLRRIDKLTADLMSAAEQGAHRQRWATGLPLERNEDGSLRQPFRAGPSELWVSENPSTSFGSFDANDLGQWLRALDAQVAELAAVSRVPAHYLMSQTLANPPSAESIYASESGLVAKVHDRQRGFGESWEAVVRLALAIAKAPGAEDRAGEMLWRDTATRPPAQAADAAVKLDSIGVPLPINLAVSLGFTPQMVARVEQSRRADDLLAAALAVPPETPPPPSSEAERGATGA